MENISAILVKLVGIRVSEKVERFLSDHGSDTSKMEEEIPFRSWNDHIWGPKIQLIVHLTCPNEEKALSTFPHYHHPI